MYSVKYRHARVLEPPRRPRLQSRPSREVFMRRLLLPLAGFAALSCATATPKPRGPAGERARDGAGRSRPASRSRRTRPYRVRPHPRREARRLEVRAQGRLREGGPAPQGEGPERRRQGRHLGAVRAGRDALARRLRPRLRRQAGRHPLLREGSARPEGAGVRVRRRAARVELLREGQARAEGARHERRRQRRLLGVLGERRDRPDRRRPGRRRPGRSLGGAQGRARPPPRPRTRRRSRRAQK